MSTPSRRRLMRDLKRLQEECPEGITATPNPENIMIWNAVIFGPQGTPFEDGIFYMELRFDESYPNNPPHCRFLNPPFHPNIYTDGNICLDILQSRWSPTYDVTALLTSIQSLLPDPNPSSAANGTAAGLFRERRGAYEGEVRKCVEASWKFKAPFSIAQDSEDEDEGKGAEAEQGNVEIAQVTSAASASAQATASTTEAFTEATEATASTTEAFTEATEATEATASTTEAFTEATEATASTTEASTSAQSTSAQSNEESTDDLDVETSRRKRSKSENE